MPDAQQYMGSFGRPMYSNMAFNGRDRNYYRLPAQDGHGSSQQTSAQLLRFDDPGLRGVKEFEYQPLPDSEMRIRLMELLGVTSEGP